MKKISIIVPCYNEQEALPLFYNEVIKLDNIMQDVSFEYVFINDGSKDDTLKVLRELHQKDNRVKYISFSRNFGKEAAMFAGLENATGDFITLMDADLQDPPSLLPDMYAAIVNEGYDSVGTRRTTRKGEPPIRSFFARSFYHVINRMSDIEMVDGARDYRLMCREVVDAIVSLKEYNRYSKGLFSFVGFKTKWIEFENVERVAGETKWSFFGLFKYALEGIIAFTTTPLTIAAVLGVLFCFIAFLLILIIITKTIIWGDPVSGWPSTMCVIFFVGGIQLFCTGIMGMYLSKTYLETKKRPIYIVGERNEDSDCT